MTFFNMTLNFTNCNKYLIIYYCRRDEDDRYYLKCGKYSRDREREYGRDYEYDRHYPK